VRGWALGLAALLVLPSVSADWLESAHDAANSNATDDAGPTLPEIAWRATLPGAVPFPAAIVGREAFVAVNQAKDRSIDGVYALGLDDASVRLVARTPPLPLRLAVRDGKVYVCGNGWVDAYALSDGHEAWPAPWTMPNTIVPPENRNYTQCQGLTFAGGNLIVGAVDVGKSGRELGSGAAPLPSRPAGLLILGYDVGDFGAMIASLDPATGHPNWRWSPQKSDLQDPTRRAPRADSGDPWIINGFAANDAVAIATLVTLGSGGIDDDLVAIDVRNGAPLWGHALAHETFLPAETRSTIPSQGGLSIATLAGNIAYVAVAENVTAINARTGDLVGSAPLGRVDPEPGLFTSVTLANDGQRVYAESAHTLYAFPVDQALASPLWTAPQANSTSGRYHNPTTVAGDVVYVRTATGDQDGEAEQAVHAYSASRGTPVWTVGLAPPGAPASWGYFMPAANGVIVATNNNGTVVVLGHTAASVDARAVASDEYPAPGAPVSVDLSSSGPGRFGAPTLYEADWGDGSTSPAQSEPRFDHAYANACDCVAIFNATNAAGQVGAQSVMFHVGASKPTFLSTAFNAENQNLTFFVIGLALTAAGGAFGLARIERRRRVLRRELASLDDSRAQLADRPLALDRLFRDRRLRAHALLLAGKLDEAQYGVLRARIDELAAAARERLIDERLRFLPHGLVQSLHEVLADGKVTRLERDHFLAAIEREALLTSEQKAEARRAVEAWFESDAGSAA
jgi:outer membrane protein assembly factor BamB